MSAQPITFQRIYLDYIGPEHPATPEYVANVLRSMNEARDHPHSSFKVRFRFADAPPVVASPKRRA